MNGNFLRGSLAIVVTKPEQADLLDDVLKLPELNDFSDYFIVSDIETLMTTEYPRLSRYFLTFHKGSVLVLSATDLLNYSLLAESKPVFACVPAEELVNANVDRSMLKKVKVINR